MARRIIIFAAGLLFFSSWANAATYYVSTAGNDANFCLQARNLSAPKKTIWGGIKCLAGGDRLEIRGGVYEENGIGGANRIPSGSSWQNATTIAAYGGESATFRPFWAGHCGLGFNSGSDKYIVIKNLVIDGTDCGGSVSDGVDGIRLASGASNIRLENMEVKNFKGNGLQSLDGTSNLEVIGSSFHHNGISGSNLFHGIYHGGDDSVFTGNSFFENEGLGIQLFTSKSGASADRNTLNGNLVYNNGEMGLAVDGSDNLILNNIIYKNSGSGIDVGYSPGSFRNKILNNTIYGNIGSGIHLGLFGAGDNTLVQNNIIYGNGAVVKNDGSGNVISFNLTADPKFTNASAGDFRLQSGSPAIDAGTSVFEVKTDIRGISRPQGSVHDIGAYEGVGGAQYGAPADDTGEQCHIYDRTKSVPAGFGAAWNVLSSARELLLGAVCKEASVEYPVGNGSGLQYIYNQGYFWVPTPEGSGQAGSWQSFNYQCQGQTVGNWCVGNATYTRQLSTTQLSTTNYYVAYICNWIASNATAAGGQWKCGCRDSSCTQNYWNLQAFKKP